MRGFGTFTKKEMTEMLRTYRAAVLMAVSLIFGIMNPMIAKLTPVLMKQFSEDFAEQGFVINKITVTAMDSWAQFDKNFPMLLLVAIVLLAGCYVKEYAKGTLIPLVTKGLSRRAVVLSKLLTQLLAWTVSFCLYACVTWGYTAYFWDNSKVQNLAFVFLYFWLAGVYLLAVVAFFSSFMSSSIQVLLGTGGVYFVLMMLGMVSIIKSKLPTSLLGCSSLLTGKAQPGDFYTAAVITVVLSAFLTMLAVVLTGRRKL